MIIVDGMIVESTVKKKTKMMNQLWLWIGIINVFDYRPIVVIEAIYYDLWSWYTMPIMQWSLPLSISLFDDDGMLLQKNNTRMMTTTMTKRWRVMTVTPTTFLRMTTMTKGWTVWVPFYVYCVASKNVVYPRLDLCVPILVFCLCVVVGFSTCGFFHELTFRLQCYQRNLAMDIRLRGQGYAD